MIFEKSLDIKTFLEAIAWIVCHALCEKRFIYD